LEQKLLDDFAEASEGKYKDIEQMKVDFLSKRVSD
jgi:hypothetical protein